MGGIEDETQQGGSVDHREQDGPPGDRGRVPGGAAVHADEGGSGGVGQQVEGDAQKDSQGQPLLPEEGQGDGKAHKAVVVEGACEGPQSPPLPGDAERPGQQGADDSVQDVEGQAQNHLQQPRAEKRGVIGPHQRGKDGGGHGNIHQQAAEHFGGGGGQHAEPDSPIAHPDEQKQPKQIGKHIPNVQHGAAPLFHRWFPAAAGPAYKEHCSKKRAGCHPGKRDGRRFSACAPAPDGI